MAKPRFNALSTQASSLSGQPFDGLKAATELLQGLEGAVKNRILGEIEAKNPALFSKLTLQLFHFSDLVQMPLNQRASILIATPTSQLAVALRGVPSDVVQVVIESLPKGAAQTLRETLLMQGKKPKSEVEAAQRALFNRAQEVKKNAQK